MTVRQPNLSARRPQTIVLFGDSFIANGFGFTEPDFENYYIARTAFHFLNQLVGAPLRIVKNAGVSGENSRQFLLRLQRDVIAYGPGYCWVSYPFNDSSGSITLPIAATIENMRTIFDTLIQSDIIPIANTGGVASTVDTAVEKDNVAQLNAFIRNYASDNGFPCIDGYASLANPATGALVTNAGYDTQHPSALGAMYHARAGLTWAQNLPTVPVVRMSSPNPYSLLGNPRMVGDNADGTNGWVQQSGITGNGPNSLTSYKSGSPATVTTQKVARTDGIQGEWAQITGTATVEADRIGFTHTVALASRWSTGAKLLGARVVDSNGNHQVCTTAGTSSGAEPANTVWATQIGATTTDAGGVVWTCVDNIKVGDQIEAFVEFKIHTVSLGVLGTLPTLLVNFNSSVGLTGLRVNSWSTPDVIPAWPLLNTSCVLRSHVVTIPRGTLTVGIFVYLNLSISTVASFSLGCIDIHKVAY